MTVKHHITLFSLLFWCFTVAQNFTHFTTKNGLPSDHVYRVTQDYQGFIWMITDKGIVKYNGTSFQVFTTKDGLPKNDIYDIRITPDDKVWFVTKASKIGYIAHDKVYAFGSSTKDKILFPNVINQNKNTITFNDSGKNYYLKDSIWNSTSFFNSDEYIYEEVISHQKIAYLASKNLDSLRLFNKQNKLIKKMQLHYKIGNFKHRGQINDSLFCWINKKRIIILNLNNYSTKTILFPKGEKSLVRFNAVNNTIQFSGIGFVAVLDTNCTFKKYVATPKSINSLFSFIDRNNNLWITTTSNGVYFIAAASRKAKYQFDNQKINGLITADSTVYALVQNKGFYKYNDKEQFFEPFLNLPEYLYSVSTITALKSTYYIGSGKALRLKKNQYITYLRNDIAKKLAYYNDTLFGFNSFGIAAINPKTFQIIQDYNQNGIRDILVLNKQLLIATSNGLKQFANKKITPIKALANFKKPIVSIVPINNKQLLLNTDGFGSYITDLKIIKQLPQTKFLDVANALAQKNKLYLATSKGVWVYAKQDEGYQLQRKITTQNGLNSNIINAIAIQNNKLLASTSSGISCIPLEQKIKDQFITLYFEKIKYNNKSITNNQSVLFNKNEHLLAQIASIDYTENNNIAYQYQLLPIQKQWTKSTSNTLSFNNLKPDSYTLSIKHKDSQKTIRFQIKPLWYQTLWFKFSSAFILLGIITVILYYLRTKELEKQRKKLQAKKKIADFELHALRSQMNPYFVFNSLNAIQYYITNNETELSEKYLVKFSRLIRMFFDFSRAKEISLEKEIKLLKGYLEIEKMRFGSLFTYQFNIDKTLNLKKTQISTMLLQPIVENAVNHGLFHNKGKGLITVDFSFVSTNTYQITITDDGVGVSKSKEIQAQSLRTNKSKTRSTQVLKERIELLNNTGIWKVSYSINDNPNGGTIVQLIFKKNDEN